MRIMPAILRFPTIADVGSSILEDRGALPAECCKDMMKKNTEAVRARPRERVWPTTNEVRSPSDWRPQPTSISREEMRRIVIEMIG